MKRWITAAAVSLAALLALTACGGPVAPAPDSSQIPSAAGTAPRSTEPVSYTHLDVYKRQVRRGPMFHIDPLSRKPVYEQIIDQMERFVLTGLMKPGTQLPSVRSLSMELSINPNTIQKAYSELDLSLIHI